MESEKGAFRFLRKERLKGRKEIREVFGKGKKYSCRGAKLFVLRNELPHNRICFTFSKISKRNQAGKESKGSWNAVTRNRAKRLGREAFRLLRPHLLGGHDLVLLVYPESETDIALSDRAEQLEFLFSKAGLLKFYGV